jgi:hypothetical protein
LRIHRSNPEANFLILPNATAQDTRLSWAARGLLIELLSRPIDWETNADALWTTSKQQRGEQLGEGRRAVRAAFAKLEELGYIVRSRARVEKGRFVTTIDVYDTAGHHRDTAGGMSAGSTLVRAASANGTSLQSTDIQRTELQSTEDKHSSTLADTRVGALTSAANEARSAWDLVDETRRAEVERERLIRGDTASRTTRRGSGILDLSNMEEGNRHLGKFYQAVNNLTDDQLRNALLVLERQRPRIYRACRNRTIDQYDRKDRGILKGQASGRKADVLSFKYALLHYYNTAAEMPAWLVRPLGVDRGRGQVA